MEETKPTSGRAGRKFTLRIGEIQIAKKLRRIQAILHCISYKGNLRLFTLPFCTCSSLQPRGYLRSISSCLSCPHFAMVNLSEVKGNSRENRTAAHTHIKGLGLRNDGTAETSGSGFVGQTAAREVSARRFSICTMFD